MEWNGMEYDTPSECYVPVRSNYLCGWPFISFQFNSIQFKSIDAGAAIDQRWQAIVQWQWRWSRRRSMPVQHSTGKVK